MDRPATAADKISAAVATAASAALAVLRVLDMGNPPARHGAYVDAAGQPAIDRLIIA
jgi:hypothetical protein